MNCRQAKRYLAEAALEILSERPALELSRHLQTCAGCREEIKSLRQASELLRKTFSDYPTPNLRPQIMRRVQALRPQPWRLQPWVPITAAAALMLALAVILPGNYFRQRNSQAILAAYAEDIEGLGWNQDYSESASAGTELEAALEMEY